MRASAKGAAAGGAATLALALASITSWEGLSLRSYPDVIGVWTACYGETQGVRPGQTYTRAQCDDMLARRIHDYADGIAPCLPATLPDPVRAAFISAAYNIGTGAFCGSSMSRKALAGDLRGACDALLLWNKAGGRAVAGLSNRRKAERDLCVSGL